MCTCMISFGSVELCGSNAIKLKNLWKLTRMGNMHLTWLAMRMLHQTYRYADHCINDLFLKIEGVQSMLCCTLFVVWHSGTDVKFDLAAFELGYVYDFWSWGTCLCLRCLHVLNVGTCVVLCVDALWAIRLAMFEPRHLWTRCACLSLALWHCFMLMLFLRFVIYDSARVAAAALVLVFARVDAFGHVDNSLRFALWGCRVVWFSDALMLALFWFAIVYRVRVSGFSFRIQTALHASRTHGMIIPQHAICFSLRPSSERVLAGSFLPVIYDQNRHKYGFRLNKKKCEHIHFGSAGHVYFTDGTKVKKLHEVTYLGCNMNDKADPEREIAKRKKTCMITLNKLHIFFYNSDNTVTRKLQMFNAIIRAKLMYGLETVVMNPRVQNMLDTFQLKCLRKIFKIPTTYIDRQFSNDYVRLQINNHLKAAKKKPMETLTEFHKRSRIRYLAKLITVGESEPGTLVTLNPQTLEEIQHGKKRIGRPRLNWYQVTMQDMWNELRIEHPRPTVRFACSLDPKKPAHVSAVREFAQKLTEKYAKK